MRSHTITCPAGQVERFEPGHVVDFDPEACSPCKLRSQCMHSANGKGRTVSIAADERGCRRSSASSKPATAVRGLFSSGAQGRAHASATDIGDNGGRAAVRGQLAICHVNVDRICEPVCIRCS
jgi:hypothetical protein